MNVTEYAAHANVDKSTISRQIAAGLIPARPIGKGRYDIDPDEADRARLANLDARKSRKVSGPTPSLLFAAPLEQNDSDDEAEDDDALAEQANETKQTAVAQGNTLNSIRTQSIQLDVQKKAIELARIAGDLVARDAVEEAQRQLGKTLADKIFNAFDDQAERLTIINDVREMRSVLKKIGKEVLNSMADDLMVEAQKQLDAQTNSDGGTEADHAVASV